ncbi:MAG: restriction endonuclease subunit S, partial [Deltaproteobacteria bacterium]|nr:restriction endonuclease subunit S [Deltaproteobacteria bacterium]
PAGIYPLVTTGEARKTAATWQFNAPTVCVPMISAFGHGKAGLKRVQYQEGKFALASILSALIVKKPEELLPKFLSVFLNFYKDQLIVPLQFGAANMSITVERLATVPIWFPSLEEQKRILNLLSEVEILIALSRETQKRMANYPPALFNEFFENQQQKSNKWGAIKIKDACEFVRGISFSTPDVITRENPDAVACFRTKNIQENLDTSDIIYIPKRFIRNDKQFLKDGDILISNANSKELVGKCCIIEKISFVATLGGFIVAARPKQNLVLPLYLYSWMSLPSTQSTFRSLSRQTINIANLSMRLVGELDITLPPLVLQREFAARVEEARGVQSAQGKSAGRVEALYQSMLARAFAGEL